MAEAILFNVAAKIIESLGSQAFKQIGLLWGVTDELKKLEDTVSAIQAVLLDAEEQSAVDRQVRNWLEKLKDVVYDADDLLDGFSTDYLLREMMTRDKMAKKVRIFFPKSNQLVYNLKMGREIKAIRQKLGAIQNDRKFHLEERPVEIGVKARKRDDTHSFVLKAEVIGREDAKKEIIDMLLSDSNVKENVGILPITGIGGLGKTTLAQFIFNDEEIDKHFHELKMWVCVSDNFDVRKVVEKILESATKKKPESFEMETLVHGLQEKIGGKKYLLVLDDVWNEEVRKWDELKKLLMTGAIGSRILVTTRSAKVARITQTIEPYSLQGLDTQKSWCLFKQVAFENGQEPVNSRKKVEVGKKIVEKCSGVPLAIKTIGRLLSLEDSEAGWDSFEKNKMAEIKENDILPTLKLSYDQLPSHLKQCFAYCSIFPKDDEMEKSMLINLWIAQGFIKRSNQNECLEDVGHEYFMDLLWRSFFQEAEMDDLGNVITTKMHDLMHDLAMSEAGSLITRLESKEKFIGDQKTRHVSVVGNIDFSSVIPTSSSRASKIRTLLCLGGLNFREYSGTSCEAIFSSLKFLRVLGLHGIQLDLVPSSICKLKHLRDLDLSWNENIEKLPDSITRLQNLYTLRLSGCINLKELPRGIMKLVNLRHLYNDGCDRLTYMPRGLGQLKYLQTLSKFVVHSNSAPEDSGRLSELNRLNSLRGELVISGLRLDGDDFALDDKGANLKEKEHLQVLTLKYWSRANVNARDENMALEGLERQPNLKKLRIDEYGGVRVPMWLLSLTNLVDLKLSDCWKLKYLPPLSGLPSLRRIRLDHLDEIEYVSDCSDNNELSSFSSSAEFFPSLEKIEFEHCRNLKGWWRRSDSYNVDVNITDHENSFETPSITRHALLFPSLSRLHVRDCHMLTSLPMFPHLERQLRLKNASWKPVQQTSITWTGHALRLPSLPSLSVSIINCYMLTSLPMFPHLVYLKLERCRRLKYLPPLSQLPSLKSLTLYILEEIEYVSDCSDNNELSSFSSSAFFPSLEAIVFDSCHNLKGWWRRSDSYNVDVNTTDHALLFPRLSKLTIRDCPKLTSLPMFPHLKEELILKIASWKPVQQTITNASSSSASSTPIAFSSPPLSKLKHIWLQQIEDLETLPVQNLISLQHLTIRSCRRLKSLSQGVQYLTALTKLELSDCPMLDLGNDEHGMQWKGLKSLISLEFTGMPKLVSLPLGLQHVTSLRRLQISDCSSLMAIPEWICNWASLELFTISRCNGLTSLPEAMSRLTSLKKLTIQDCPILLRRCEQERGNDSE
ncbi:putative disease resistance protein RGA4 isoform X2 [Carya illinoinensis]|uniref:putative disease resistance protein RGA4 isoform X2 n=1 Tax=Carya illinoinensis TaxID=32201 RepID=UPI001C723178|nr:putative disease resistance protein RGA4 isoform X2 [Carya illinoinensis]